MRTLYLGGKSLFNLVQEPFLNTCSRLSSASPPSEAAMVACPLLFFSVRRRAEKSTDARAHGLSPVLHDLARLAPVLEVFLDGRHLGLPFCQHRADPLRDEGIPHDRPLEDRSEGAHV